MNKQTIRIRRVGTFTFGIILVVTGVINALWQFFPRINYEIVFRFWPLILIMLGIEVLLGSRQKVVEVLDGAGNIIEQNKVVYDVAAMVLTFVLTGFAMIMAMMNWMFTHATRVVI